MFRALRAADRGRRRQFGDAIRAALLGARGEPDRVDRVLADLDGDGRGSRDLTPEAQARALSSMANSLGAISMDEYRQRIGGRK